MMVAAVVVAVATATVAMFAASHVLVAQREFEDRVLAEQAAWRVELLEGVEDVFSQRGRAGRNAFPDCPSEGWEDHQWN